MSLEKLQFGILAFETEQGTVYVWPARRERARLLWTFRNFGSLSVKQLNAKERHLVRELYAHADSAPEPNPDLIIGRVEDAYHLSSVEAVEARRKVVALGERTLEEKVIRTSLIRKESPERVTGRPNWKWALASGVLCVVVTTLLWHHGQAPETLVNAAPAAQSAALVEVQPVRQVSSSETRTATPPVQSDTAPASPAPPSVPDSSTANLSSLGTTPVANITRIIDPNDPADADVVVRHIPLVIPVSRVQTDVLEVSRPPRQIIYPQVADHSARGKVSLRAVVTADGTVREVKILSGDDTLAQAAARAVRQWQYGPYYLDGHAVGTETNVDFSFVSADVISISFPQGAVSN